MQGAVPRIGRSQNNRSLEAFKRALDLEKQIILSYIEKIASLDAADIKLKPRRGSTFPSKDGVSSI